MPGDEGMTELGAAKPGCVGAGAIPELPGVAWAKEGPVSPAGGGVARSVGASPGVQTGADSRGAGGSARPLSTAARMNRGGAPPVRGCPHGAALLGAVDWYRQGLGSRRARAPGQSAAATQEADAAGPPSQDHWPPRPARRPVQSEVGPRGRHARGRRATEPPRQDDSRRGSLSFAQASPAPGPPRRSARVEWLREVRNPSQGSEVDSLQQVHRPALRSVRWRTRPEGRVARGTAGDGITMPGRFAGPFAAASIGARPDGVLVLTVDTGGTGAGCLRASSRARFAASLSGSNAGGSVGNLTCSTEGVLVGPDPVAAAGSLRFAHIARPPLLGTGSPGERKYDRNR